MSENRIAGAAKQAKGAIKETAGKAVGNTKLQAEGAADKAVGSAQNKLGKAQDKVAAAIKGH